MTETTAIQEYTATEAALAVLREEYANAVYPVDTAKGLQEAKAARAEIRDYRTSLEKKRVEIKAPALERCRLIDTEAKRITAALLELEEPIDAQIKKEEARKEAERQAKIEAERKRVEAIQERIADIRSAAEAVTSRNYSSANIAVFITDTEAHEIGEFFEEFREQAEDAKAATLARLRDAHAAAVEREAEQGRIAAERAELARLRAEQAEREAKERAAREAAEAEARAKREAEEAAARAAREEEDRKQRQALDAERKRQAEEQARIDAENRRIAEERAKLEREQAEARRREEEAERRRQAEAAAERKRQDEALKAAKKRRFPGEAAIVNALALHFAVPEEVVRGWLSEIRKAA